MREDNSMICSVCRTVLGCEMSAFGLTYFHEPMSIPDDGHEPVPVPMPEDFAKGICDFCGGAGPEYEFPAREFSLGGRLWEGPWAACEPCKLLIDADRWEEVSQRTLAAHTERFGGEPNWVVVAHVTAMHEKARLFITGPARRIGEASK